MIRTLLVSLLLTVSFLQPANAQGEQAGAGTASLEQLLSHASEHPGVRAAQAALDAAEAQLRAARSPVSLEVGSNLTRLDVDDIDINPVEPGIQPLDRTLLNLSAGVTLRPFAFGDIADLVDQRQVAVEQARLDLRSALVSMQARTLEAAYELELASAGVAVAEEGVQLATEALEATEVRANRGAASERELREARRGLAEAENLLQDARENEDLARMSLASLVPGEVPALGAEAFDLPLPSGDPADVVRAGLQVRLAELAPRGAARALLPTAQASYSWNLGEHDTLTVGLESRTLQPNINFSHEAQGRTFPQTEIRGALTVGVSWTISPGAIESLNAAEAQLQAARLGLEATAKGAELQARALMTAVGQAERAADLAADRLADAKARLDETRARVNAGLATPLELQNDSLSHTRAQVDLRSARLGVLRATLDLYEFYALPIATATEADER